MLIVYVWRGAGGARLALPGALLGLLLFPQAQLAFPINDAPMRPPLALAALGAGLAYLGGGSVFG
ncbi:hypothetical protein [Pseudomonas aeruginosa]|uniref:hypothetical protein n=1 Tax=Pseudomonas aeruginosa TaxID=287 RepID=UPI003D2D03E7